MFIDDAAHNSYMTAQINQEANTFNTFLTTHSHFLVHLFRINIIDRAYTFYHQRIQ